MPLTKQYLTYSAECRYGTVAGRKGGALLSHSGGNRLVVVSSALEDVKIWDPRTSTVLGELRGAGSEVSVICLTQDGSVLATGLQDGGVVLWDLDKRTSRITFNGHKSAVMCLHFNSTNTQLVSGSKDTHVIVWDVVSEAGLFRFKGHKGPITECRFLSTHNVLVTSSRDGLVKLWDLHTQHCFQTLVSHHREVWSFEVVGGAGEGAAGLPWLVVASGDPELKVYQLTELGAREEKVPVVAKEMGSVRLSSSDRVSMLRVDHTCRYMAALTASGVEVYYIRSPGDLQQLLKRRRKKAKSKDSEETESEVELSTKDWLKLVCSIKGSGKHRSVSLHVKSGQELIVLLTLQNNTLEVHSVKDKCGQLLYSISSPGHRTDVRTLCFSSDNSRILSASAKQVKIWNTSTRQCVCTLTSRYALCSLFVPGDRYAVIGTKSGHVQLFDLSSSSLLEELSAHEGAVWGLSLYPDKRGVATGSADHSVKFWEFELVSSEQQETQAGKRLTLAHTRSLKLSEDVLGVCHSPNGRLLAVALLDSTIKVFFTDTLKFFLSLYGHKLPVLSLDISSDSTLLASCSADKNVRIWGLDFGDCHKSIFAHEDSVMCVHFVPDTHLLFSASKDCTLKCWDADNFQHVQTLKGHHGEVWCLAVSSDGDTVVSGSHDMSIGVWHRTAEPLVLSEQRELEREAFMDQISSADVPEHVIPGEVASEVALPLTKSKETVSSVDRLLEALAIWTEEKAKAAEHKRLCVASGKDLAPPRPHPMLVAKGDIQAERYVLDVVKGIRSSELEECLLVMPFDQMVELLQLTDYWLEQGWEVELSCRCLFFLLRVHHPQLTSSHSLLPSLHSLAQHTATQVSRLKDLFGFNLAGLQFLRRQLDSRGTRVFEDAPALVRKKRKKTV